MNSLNNPMIECACGCGTLLNKYDDRGRERRFVHGHHGRCMSDKTKKKISYASKHQTKGSRIKQGNSLRGFKHTEESKKNMSRAQKGKKVSDEARKNMSESHKGKKPSEETKEELSKSLKGRKLSEEHKRNLSKASKGKVISEEQRKKISEMLKGDKSPNYGKTFSKEHCENISKGKIGKKASEETKRKLSEAHIGLQAGENHYNWQGGISFEPYCQKFNEAFKEKIREAFDRKCFLCEKTEVDDGRKLSVHHVQYNKNCGCDDDLKCDFAPLCMSCHAKTNSNREYWENKIILMLSEMKLS